MYDVIIYIYVIAMKLGIKEIFHIRCAEYNCSIVSVCKLISLKQYISIPIDIPV